MSRLLPSTLFGRLVLILLGGLLVAQLVGAAILLRDRASALYESGGHYAVQRIAGIVNVLDELSDEQRRRILPAMNTAGLRVALATEPGREPASEEEDMAAAHLSGALRSALGEDREVRIAVTAPEALPADLRGPRPAHMGHMMPQHMPFMGGPPITDVSFLVRARLRDGQWVSIAHGLPQETFTWPAKLLLTLAFLLVSVIVLSLVAVRWVTRPLADLGRAADELGRDIQRPPLAVRGPLEVRRAAQAFNTMQARLAQFLRDRAQMLAAVSHDLKTPITRLRLRAELLDEPDLKGKFVHDLDEMETMTRATLDFLRDAGTREPAQPIDVDALVESLQSDAGELGQEVLIQGGTASPYTGRPLALQRCLRNLIENAVNYGKRATVSVDDSAERLQIVVADEGPGIPEDRLAQVFEPFVRLDPARSRETGGAGLGLSIARDIARAHGGDLALRNRASGGLEAVLTLPR
jgi:signal transduction histidine kinase